jgi:hypothetical protein
MNRDKITELFATIEAHAVVSEYDPTAALNAEYRAMVRRIHFFRDTCGRPDSDVDYVGRVVNATSA